jgi:hypothetical protein
MNHLKNENVNKCFSLLREYLNEGPFNNKKGAAILALDHLQRITAGSDSQGASHDGNSSWNTVLGCHGKPRASQI